MEIESSSAPIMSKKLWNKGKLVLYMLRKTLAKTKLLVDLHIKLKNGKLARKAFTTLLLHHHYAASSCRCTSNNIDTLFISPQEHTLRSNNTSPYSSKRKSHHHPDDDNKIERVLLEVLNNGCATIEPSPLVLPATPVVSHELKMANSPANAEEESQVDKAAEEFIKKFYRQLQQQRNTYVESPSPHHLWAQ